MTDDPKDAQAPPSEEIMLLRAELGKVRCENEALGKWKCEGCGCRFEQLPKPEFMLEGVTRCSKCVENEVLANENIRFRTFKQSIAETLVAANYYTNDPAQAIGEMGKALKEREKELAASQAKSVEFATATLICNYRDRSDEESGVVNWKEPLCYEALEATRYLEKAGLMVKHKTQNWFLWLEPAPKEGGEDA